MVVNIYRHTQVKIWCWITFSVDVLMVTGKTMRKWMVQFTQSTNYPVGVSTYMSELLEAIYSLVLPFPDVGN